MAVGGLFYGEPGYGLIGQFQRNEYARYQRLVARKSGRVFVLTGTASLVRAYALSAVAQARGDLVPGTRGNVYDTQAMTEDNELTLALKTLGAKMTSPHAVPGHHRAHAQLEGAVAPTAPLAARRPGEHRSLRAHPSHGAVLGPTADPGVQRRSP